MKAQDINDAISKHVILLWFTDEIRQAIRISYGQDVLSCINDMYRFAGDGLYWSNDDIVSHANVVSMLKTQHPYLADESAIRIANMAAYFWK